MTTTTASPSLSSPELPPTTRSIASIFQSPVGRLVMLLLLWLLLQIPLSMITNLVHERQARRDEAVVDVTGKWGGAQQLMGPILRLPYIVNTTDAKGNLRQERRAAYLLPENLLIEAKLNTEERRRGIFSIPVYGAGLHITGHFQRPDVSAWIGTGNEALWQEMELQIGLSDVRAIHADGQLTWNGQAHALEPSAGSGAPAAGVHIPLGKTIAAGNDAFGSDGRSNFELNLKFNGSGSLHLAPTGRNSKATVQADWGDPSFQGAWLPTESQVQADRFSATWSISYLGRGYPQQWTSDGDLNVDVLNAQVFGVALLPAIDAYRMAERVTKYAVLAAFFTFLTIWLTEVLARRPVHPVQYLFLGAALTLFGLLQLSIGEHFGFEAGFVAATIAVTGMVTAYSRSVLDGWLRAFMVGGLLGGLYGYLYLLLSAEDYALLGGSIALFAGLGIVMLLTRRIDWHRLGASST
ncbi:MAG: cell envelope integrity protein CreD [Pseudomonadota bacterium]|nr:cell envelope integrity protein CreD [Pseudomonadota bacterium]